MKESQLLLIGGAGFIGSHINRMLSKIGYPTIILDNLSTGSREAVGETPLIVGDMGDAQILKKIFKENRIGAVLHFAALTNVGESIREPLKYYQNNVANTLNLLMAMKEYAINVLVFSSTAAVYGYPQRGQIDETHPCQPINPYGESKLMVESILVDCDRAYGLRYCSLRYFNAAGGDPEGKIRNYKTEETNLIPIILKSLCCAEAKATIFGTDYPTFDGTCIRDYIHIEDLGFAHIAALKQLLGGTSSNCYNLGSEKGYSVREVISAVKKVTGKEIAVVEGPRREGDPPILIANAEKAKRELGWQPRYSLEEMIEHAWRAMKEKL